MENQNDLEPGCYLTTQLFNNNEKEKIGLCNSAFINLQ